MPESQRIDLIQTIRAAEGTLSPKLRRIARHALGSPTAFIRSTSRRLCADLGTSEPTLIRFCQGFGYGGLAEFRIDLALSLAQRSGFATMVEPNADDRRQVNLDAKRGIARRAASLVAQDASILVDNGSSAELFAQALGDLPEMVVMTTGLGVAHNLLSQGRHRVMLPGGTIRSDSLSLSGPLVDQALAGMRFDTLVIGGDSVDPDFGLSTFREDEAHQNRAMVEAAERVVVLADASKFMKPCLHRICPIERIAVVVTDMDPGAEAARRIAERGVRLVSTKDEAAP